MDIDQLRALLARASEVVGLQAAFGRPVERMEVQNPNQDDPMTDVSPSATAAARGVRRSLEGRSPRMPGLRVAAGLPAGGPPAPPHPNIQYSSRFLLSRLDMMLASESMRLRGADSYISPLPALDKALKDGLVIIGAGVGSGRLQAVNHLSQRYVVVTADCLGIEDAPVPCGPLGVSMLIPQRERRTEAAFWAWVQAHSSSRIVIVTSLAVPAALASHVLVSAPQNPLRAIASGLATSVDYEEPGATWGETVLQRLVALDKPTDVQPDRRWAHPPETWISMRELAVLTMEACLPEDPVGEWTVDHFAERFDYLMSLAGPLTIPLSAAVLKLIPPQVLPFVQGTIHRLTAQ